MRFLELVDRAAQFLHGVRETHLDLGHALPDRDGMVAARLVAAGATVELVRGVPLVHARQDRDDLLRCRHVVKALVGRRERAREVERCILRHRGVPRRLVARLVTGARLAADVGATLEDGLITAEARAHDAALAAEDVEQSRLGLAVFEFHDGVDQIGAPVGTDDVAAEKILGRDPPPGACRA